VAQGAFRFAGTSNYPGRHPRCLSRPGGQLLACLKRPEVRDGRWQLLEVRPAWEGNPTWDRFLAFAWEGEADQRLIITVNYGPTQGQCQAALPWDDLRGKQVILHDLVQEGRYEWQGDDLCNQGLYVDLPAWGFHVVACNLAD
jgi:hypothetical protein